jgi:dTDP-4-dehydrorhamnose 3,5-epimerase
MKATRTPLPGVILLEPAVFEDERGSFFESYNKRVLAEFGINAEFVQDNHCRSIKQVLRGLHYQIQQAQGKLVRVVTGEVFDVAVDVRRSSPSFGKWFGSYLSAANRRVVWIPPGFAHGYLVISDVADCLYKTTEHWAPQFERTIAWDDPDIGIAWPLRGEPILAAKDRAGLRLHEAPAYE